MEQSTHRLGIEDLRYFTLIALLVFAPLFRAGNRPIPLMVMEFGALALLLLLLWEPERLRRLPVSILVVGLALVTIPLAHLLPVPESLWPGVPGRALYAAAVGEAVPGGWRPLSVIAARSEWALYTALPAVAAFGAVYLLPVERTKRLVYLLLVIAAVQAALGLMQFGAGAASPLFFGNPFAAAHTAAGTYANRDHLAGLLEMVFPVTLALLSATLGHRVDRRRGRGRWRRRIEFVSSLRGHRAMIFAALAVLLILGLIFTRSRAGVALAMLGLFLSLLAYSGRLGGSNVYGTLGTVIAVILVLALEIGLAPVLDRFTRDPLQDARWQVFSSSLEGIGSFFPVGAGAGTYPQVYPAFQPVDLGSHFINHAHNDYLEALFEGGVLSLLVILAILFLFARQWFRVWIKGRWSSFRFVQVGAGTGLLLMALHSLVDFNLHIPANALVLSVLAGVFFKEYKEEPRRRRRPKPRPAPQQTPQSPDQAKRLEEWQAEENPFL